VTSKGITVAVIIACTTGIAKIVILRLHSS